MGEKKVVATRFEIVFGVNPGYFHENEGGFTPEEAEKAVATEWRKALEVEFAESDILVGAFTSPGKIIYPADFGCPSDGEIAVAVTGNSNAKFTTAEAIPAFKDAVIRVAKAVKIALQQERVQIAFSNVNDFVYLEPEDAGGDQRW